MLFNSWEYAIFLPLIFLIYWQILKTRAQQNLFLLAASYLFYGWWDYRFLTVIFISSVSDYLLGLQISKQKRPIFLVLEPIYQFRDSRLFQICQFFY